VCEKGSGSIILASTEPGVTYQLLSNESVIEEKVGEGNELSFSVESSTLTKETNDFTVQAVGSCGNGFVIKTISISRSVLEKPSVQKGTVCTTGTTTLKATASGAASYNWYENEFATQPVADQHSDTFTTGSINKTKTYYVSYINAGGCESQRVPVAAEVVLAPEVSITISDNILSSSISEGNQWYVDGNLIEGETKSTIIPVVSGLYTLKNYSSGCLSSTNFQYYVSNLPGGLTVYPNPAKDVVNFHFNEQKSLSSASVFDSNGKKVGDFALQGEGQNIKGEYFVRNLTPGVYIVKFFVEKELVIVKFIKE
jgi:hypothetical protein